MHIAAVANFQPQTHRPLYIYKGGGTGEQGAERGPGQRPAPGSGPPSGAPVTS